MPNNWQVLDTRSGGACVVLADVPKVPAGAVWSVARVGGRLAARCCRRHDGRPELPEEPQLVP